MSATDESIAAHAVIKAFDLQGIMLASFGRRLATLFRSTVRASWLSGLQGTSISGSGSILLIVAIVGGATLAVRGELSVGGLVAVIDLLWFIVANLQALSKVVPPIQRAAGGMLRIQEVLDVQDQVNDRVGAQRLPPFSQAILVLDEPASALDAQTEASIHQTLQRLAKGRTVISVTHRLTTSTSDRILVLSAGRLVEEGHHFDLVALDGIYSQLWRAQSQSDVAGIGSQADATIDSINLP